VLMQVSGDLSYHRPCPTFTFSCTRRGAAFAQAKDVTGAIVACKRLLGRSASLIGLQRYVNTNRVSNDGVPGVSRSLDDLPAALANSSKTLREVIDRQTQYPHRWDSGVITARMADFRRRHTVGSPHFESAVNVGRRCRPSNDLFVKTARRRDIRNHKRQPRNLTNTVRLGCCLRFARLV
jgi:hypothetical protein